nr:hypothetical protein [Tanacetum cinerariifolium]
MCEWPGESVNSKMQSQQGRINANDTDFLCMNEMIDFMITNQNRYAVIESLLEMRGKCMQLLSHTLVLPIFSTRGCDPLALVDSFTIIEDNACLLETRFDEESICVFVFPEDVMGLVNLTLLSLFFVGNNH